jgi:hypothetical protein
LRGGDFLKSAFRAIGGAVVIAASFKRNTGAVQSRLVSPFLNYSHFLNSPCVDQYPIFSKGFRLFSLFSEKRIFFKISYCMPVSESV